MAIASSRETMMITIRNEEMMTIVINVSSKEAIDDIGYLSDSSVIPWLLHRG